LGVLRKIARGLIGLVALVALLGGGLGLALAYAPDQTVVQVAAGLTAKGLQAAAALSANAPEDLPDRVLTALGGFPLRFVVGPVGLVLLIWLKLPGGRGDEVEEGEDGEVGTSRVDPKALKKTRKQAQAIARKGMPLEAAELCFAVGLMDEATDYFVDADEFVRAAEIRHDQNRFEESAELYLKAGNNDAAGVIYAQLEDWAKAADAYVQAGNLSVAAEMYEKAGNHRRAAQCFQKCEFPRHAAQAWVRCEEWENGAKCLEQVMLDEGPGAMNDPAKEVEYKKLVRMTGNLYERAGHLERAQKVLAKGGLFSVAADVAAKRGDREAAAEFYLKGRNPERAAAMLKELGENEKAARILAEYHRDRGEQQEAAAQFEAAGELLEAGDLYRLLEQYERAGECYERFGDGAQAAEMFGLAGDRARAAQNYENAGRFAEAAECAALSGDSEREAELLEKGGDCLRAGLIHRESGRREAAMAALQQVAPDSEGFAEAAAIIGEMFREDEKYSLAIAKLGEAVAGREIDRDTVRAFFCLATCHEASGDARTAHGLYEKILAFDVQYEDTEQRLERTRAALAKLEAEEAAAAEAERSRSAASGKPDRYKICGTLGRGGMGIVYKAEDTVLDRVVAFKVLPEALKENPQALKNFLREAKSAAQLNHPNIVTVYDAGEQDDVFYIAMEYVDGNTLKDIIKRRGAIAARGIVHVVAQLAEALAYAHEKKIVHRDIKTANAMWTKDRKAKIMDFGLAKVVEEVRNHTTVVSGTPYYMSPEQTLGKNVDHRTDLYSLGVSIFEMATGTLPFTEGNLPYHHVHTPPPDPREINPEVPEVLAGIIERCLRKDPAERYQSAREILAELRTELTS
jgi:tetratricopeptide (TPR) repeat protein